MGQKCKCRLGARPSLPQWLVPTYPAPPSSLQGLGPAVATWALGRQELKQLPLGPRAHGPVVLGHSREEKQGAISYMYAHQHPTHTPKSPALVQPLPHRAPAGDTKPDRNRQTGQKDEGRWRQRQGKEALLRPPRDPAQRRDVRPARVVWKVDMPKPEAAGPRVLPSARPPTAVRPGPAPSRGTSAPECSTWTDTRLALPSRALWSSLPMEAWLPPLPTPLSICSCPEGPDGP